jgi:hypothetical protein
MRITEQEFWVFVVGAAIGSIVTYWIATREKRIVSGVRSEISRLAAYHELTRDQKNKAQFKPSEITTHEQILESHPWAARYSRHLKKKGIKLSPISIIAEQMICEKLSRAL